MYSKTAPAASVDESLRVNLGLFCGFLTLLYFLKFRVKDIRAWRTNQD